MSADVFISYRGADRVLARKLEHRLRSRWGSRVFRDETGVTSGRNWATELTDAMREARVIIALIGPGWHLSADRNTEDWVRKELAAAVEGAKPILPVLVGESEELRPKLEAMPEAFQTQAVVVGPELAGFDLHQIARALGNLGASRSDDTWSLTARRDQLVPKHALAESERSISAGESLLLVGASGSGRHALMQRLVENLVCDGHLVASYGVAPGESQRYTHAVISGWIKSLSDTLIDPTSRYSIRPAREALIDSILSSGPDLLSRRVVKASMLLPLGGSRHDQLILEAVRRSTDRWAPFPPTRLRNQSRQVLESLLESLSGNDRAKSILGGKKLILVVDHFDGVDSNSRELVNDLLQDSLGANVQFIIAAYESNRKIGEVGALHAPGGVRMIDIDAQCDWGDHIKPWLASHNVQLSEAVKRCIEDERNPYQALAKLWYLVDNGIVTEPPRQRPKRKSKKPTDDEDAKPVIWDLSPSYAAHEGGNGKQPAADLQQQVSPVRDLLTQERLLGHMVSEHVPVKFRRLVEAGALMGRTFSFYAAYAAANPPASDETVDESLSTRERNQWLKEAKEAWLDLKSIDPDRSVLSCSESDNGDLLVTLAQALLIGHLRNQLSPREARVFHERLARYLMNPIEQLDQQDYGVRYYRANLAAEHWTLARRPRDAADAHRNAAQLAERSLAYGECRKHYHTAIRLYTQLLADPGHSAREHEDLLILANCYYRIARTTRLAGNPGKQEESKGNRKRRPWGAINYLERAQKRLKELEALLLKNEPDRWPDGVAGPRHRGIPGPNLVRHHLRVYNAVSGHVHLELAQCHEEVVAECRARAGAELHTCEKCEHGRRAVRDRLFDALRHAEAAQGEAGSRWLLVAASARLAHLLADESLRIQRTDKEQCEELAIEAFFHIERIIGFEPYAAEEKHKFTEAVSEAWRSAGRLFRHHALEARIAEWCFRKMNAHGRDAAATVDMITDLWLGGFLLSICRPGVSFSQEEKPETIIDEAKKLFERHRDWAIESGIIHWRTPAHLRLYLLELVASATDVFDQQKRNARVEHLDKAWRHAKSDRLQRECSLFQACEQIVTAENDPFTPDVIAKFRQALVLHSDPQAADYVEDEEVIQRGATTLAGIVLRRCPRLHRLFRKIADLDWFASQQDIEYWLTRAEDYERSLHGGPILSPCIDNDKNSCIQRLAKYRLPSAVFEKAKKVAQEARALIELPNVRALCENEEAESIGVLRRDVEYAAFIHDWYRGTDPARLLTLASEWRLTISGQEWSNPRLLQGRLATTVLKKMYDAEAVLGQSRYGRITTMVENSVVGKPDQTVLTKLFFLAKVKAERDTGSSDWLIDRSQEPGFDINAAYLDTIERKKRGLWELGYVHAASNDSRAPTPTALPNSELGPEVQEPVSEYSHDLISRAR